MPKENIKLKAINDERILKVLEPVDSLSLIDTHRKTPRAKGGNYTDDNTVVAMPKEHMKEHGIWRDREPTLDNLKAIMDDRSQVMKLRNKISNQILAFQRGVDVPDDATTRWLMNQQQAFECELRDRDKGLAAFIKRYRKVDPLVDATMKVKGIGPVTVASCRVYIDLEKSRHASSVWKYVGLHCAAHERFTKNEAGGGNKTLRTILFTMADSQMKGASKGSAYGHIYTQVKQRLEQSEKMTRTRITGKTGVHEKPWKDVSKGHRHAAALRAIMKHFLADYWFVGRELMGLPTDALYAEAQLGKTHKTINPRERGWDW